MLNLQHQFERARERYGVQLVPADVVAMAAKCRDGRGELVETEPRSGHEGWVIRWLGREMLAIYDRNEHRIITFAPWAGRSEFLLVHRVRVTRRGREVVGGVAQLLEWLDTGGEHAGAA